MVKRIYVEKREGFNIPAKNLLEDFKETLDIKNLQAVRLLVRYLKKFFSSLRAYFFF